MYIHTGDELSQYAVDESTGEMLFYQTNKLNVCTETVQDISPMSRHYTVARDEQELFDIVNRYKEKRYSEVTYLLDKKSLGRWYIPVLKLCSKVNYFNVGFYDRKEVASILGVQLSSLNKTLNKLVSISLLTYSGKGLSVPSQIRIVWNPFSVWRGWLGSNTRTVAIQDWYKSYFKIDTVCSTDCVDKGSTQLNSTTIKELEYIPPSPDPYVSGWFNLLPKDRFDNLMALSDADFELYLIEANS